MLREWIIFALCLGAGGHIALGVMLHSPDLWPRSTAGYYGLISGLVVYGVVQGVRMAWRAFRRQRDPSPSHDKPGTSW